MLTLASSPEPVARPPRTGSAGQRGDGHALIEALRADGERRAGRDLTSRSRRTPPGRAELAEVIAAKDAARAADRINGLLGARAQPPRLTTQAGTG